MLLNHTAPLKHALPRSSRAFCLLSKLLQRKVALISRLINHHKCRQTFVRALKHYLFKSIAAAWGLPNELAMEFEGPAARR